eukprot:CAMPEP_0119314662 /NCGR_PEP_ID=MMETSP1333-20130426/33637_1 /TAXON_ID=418940 /ORGANISM="Scyphosphaera apsteinii, Strain RCC1455" /LENGTH=227 /DNA_ID=CAMNT_0007319831 /DNA_START=196 /DNA_END=879 /DNA_ORIENTATION=+
MWLLLGLLCVAAGPPRLTYFNVAGRAELARLYAAVGNLTIIDNTDTDGYKSKTPSGYVPVLAHAGLFPTCAFEYGCLQESLAIERYVRDIAPGFHGLTPEQRAVDDMFAQIKEDILQGVEDKGVIRPVAAVDATFTHFFGVLELFVPKSGFVHGHAFPTGADLAVLVSVRAGFPFAQALESAQFNVAARYPKVAALAVRTATAPAVAAYLNRSTTFYERHLPSAVFL